MGKVKSAFEIAMEKAGSIGALSEEEKERMKDEEKVISILREFYSRRIDSNGLWQQLQGSNASLLRMAQMSIIRSLGLGNATEELENRMYGILAIETLKNKPNTAIIESALRAIRDLQKDYEGMKESVMEDLKRQIEMHPQLRMQPVRTPDGRTVRQMTLSVDDAVKARLGEYLSEQEKQYNEEFAGIIRELEEHIK
jgi:hypothetical protein